MNLLEETKVVRKFHLKFENSWSESEKSRMIAYFNELEIFIKENERFTLGRKIKEARLSFGMSIEAASEEFGIPVGKLKLAEQGIFNSLTEGERLAMAGLYPIKVSFLKTGIL